MAKEPLGLNAYNGLAVPTAGESETRQFDSSRTIRTLTHSTANTGRFFTFRDYRVPGSTLTNADLLAITEGGGLQGLSSVAGDNQLYGFNQPIISPTTGANYQVTSTQSGTMFNIGNNGGTSQLLLLLVNPSPGFWFETFVSTQTGVDDFQINSTADSSALITLPGLSSVVSETKAIQPASVRAHAIRMTAISSIVWLAAPIGQPALAETTVIASHNEVAWTTATTA